MCIRPIYCYHRTDFHFEGYGACFWRTGLISDYGFWNKSRIGQGVVKIRIRNLYIFDGSFTDSMARGEYVDFEGCGTSKRKVLYGSEGLSAQSSNTRGSD